MEMALHAMAGWFVHLSIHPPVHSLANSLIRSFLGLREQPNYKHCRSPILQPPGRLEANRGEVYRRSGTGGRPSGRAYKLFFLFLQIRSPFVRSFVYLFACWFARSLVCTFIRLHLRSSFVHTVVLRSFVSLFTCYFFRTFVIVRSMSRLIVSSFLGRNVSLDVCRKNTYHRSTWRAEKVSNAAGLVKSLNPH